MHIPTYPSPKQILTLNSHLRQNVGLAEGQVGRFPETYTEPKFSAIKQTSSENSRLSSLPAAKVVSTGGTSAPQRQKFHTDDVNKC